MSRHNSQLCLLHHAKVRASQDQNGRPLVPSRQNQPTANQRSALSGQVTAPAMKSRRLLSGPTVLLPPSAAIGPQYQDEATGLLQLDVALDPPSQKEEIDHRQPDVVTALHSQKGEIDQHRQDVVTVPPSQREAIGQHREDVVTVPPSQKGGIDQHRQDVVTVPPSQREAIGQRRQEEVVVPRLEGVIVLYARLDQHLTSQRHANLARAPKSRPSTERAPSR
jgi:hypothetical protein